MTGGPEAADLRPKTDGGAEAGLDEMLCSPGPWGPLPWHKAEPATPQPLLSPGHLHPRPQGWAASAGLGWAQGTEATLGSPRSSGETQAPPRAPGSREAALDTMSTDGLTFPAPRGVLKLHL